MGACLLSYIPAHLHYDEKSPLEEFFISERIYRRCRPELIKNPFFGSLRDVSVNRQGPPGKLWSEPDDVLWNIEPEEPEERYTGEKVVELEIKEVDEDATPSTYRQHVTLPDSDIVVTITLLHKPLNCNFAHSEFQFLYNGTPVEPDTYRNTLGKKNSIHEKLRERCRNVLGEMIRDREIWINLPPPNDEV